MRMPCAGTEKQKSKVRGLKELWWSQILEDVEADETAIKVDSEQKHGDLPPLFCGLWFEISCIKLASVLLASLF